jgi:hypothetical protein
MPANILVASYTMLTWARVGEGRGSRDLELEITTPLSKHMIGEASCDALMRKKFENICKHFYIHLVNRKHIEIESLE